MCAQTKVLLLYDIVEHKKGTIYKKREEWSELWNKIALTMIYDWRERFLYVPLCVLLSTLCFAFVFAPSTALNGFVALEVLCASVWITIVAIGSFSIGLFLIIGYAILPCLPSHSLPHYTRLSTFVCVVECIVIVRKWKKSMIYFSKTERKLLFCSAFCVFLFLYFSSFISLWSFQTPPFCAMAFWVWF